MIRTATWQNTVQMQSKATTVQQYLKELPADRRAVIEGVRTAILQNLDPVFEGEMQCGVIGHYVPHRVYSPGYHCDPKQPLPFMGLASQKNYLSLYHGCVYGPEREKPFREAWAKTGKKLDMGKSCVRFKKLEDLALDLIGESIGRMSARKCIDYYESVIKTARRRPAVRLAGERGRNTQTGPRESGPANSRRPSHRHAAT